MLCRFDVKAGARKAFDGKFPEKIIAARCESQLHHEAGLLHLLYDVYGVSTVYFGTSWRQKHSIKQLVILPLKNTICIRLCELHIAKLFAFLCLPVDGHGLRLLLSSLKTNFHLCIHKRHCSHLTKQSKRQKEHFQQLFTPHNALINAYDNTAKSCDASALISPLCSGDTAEETVIKGLMGSNLGSAFISVGE